LQLRYLQTLTDIAIENNSTIVFPLPLDIITPFLNTLRQHGRTTPLRGEEDDSERASSFPPLAQV
jgi:hypothetical protein